VEKIVSTFDRYDDIPGYARRVSLAEIGGEANDWNLNIRRYVDNSPPPEPQDVCAHLLGGVPAAEVEAKRALFEATGFDASQAFAARAGDVAYLDFASALSERSAIRPLVENDSGVQARSQSLRDGLFSWWATHALYLADLPARRDLNAVRAEFLNSFVAALEPLAHWIASSWRESSPPGGPTRCPTSRPCSRMAFPV